jgi:hypothetical protein
MLPGEKRADYNALSAAIFDEWAPDGVRLNNVSWLTTLLFARESGAWFNMIRSGCNSKSIRPAKRTKLIVIRHPYGSNGRCSAEPSDGLESANTIVQLQQLARPQL